METTTEVKAVVTAEDRASATLRNIRRELDRLAKSAAALSAVKVAAPQIGASPAVATRAADALTRNETRAAAALQRRLAFQARMGRQQAAEAREAEQERRLFEAAAVRDLRTRMAATTRAARQALAEQRTIQREQERAAAQAERDRRTSEAAGMRDFRARMALTGRMARQKLAEERTVERERQRAADRADREAAVSARQQGREDRRREQDEHRTGRTRADARHDVRQGLSDAGGRLIDSSRTIAIYGGIATGAAVKLAAFGLKSRAAIDAAEANLRMFGGQSREQVEAARSGWLNSAAIDNGFRAADALNAFTETLKAGIPQLAAPDVTRSIMGASAGLDLNVAETTKLVGRLATLTQDPKRFAPESIDRMLNGIAVVAKVTAADSRELVSSLRRGAGVLGSSKMSVEDLTAFTGVGISAGMQQGAAGTFLDFIVNDLVNAKNSRGQRRDDLQKAFSLLGLGSTATVSRQTAQDPTSVLLKIFERLSEMDPEKAGRVASLIGMREWRGEVLMMSKAAPMLRQTVEAGRDPKNANHLKQARDERLGTLYGLRDQVRAAFDVGWDAIGAGLEDITRDIGKFFLEFGKNLKLDVIKAHVKTTLDGFVSGLGFANITQLLERVFGKPGAMSFASLNNFFKFAEGFGRGVRDVVDSVAGVLKTFAGADADAERMGRLAAQILGFSVALATVAPLLGVVASIASMLTSLGAAATALTALSVAGGAGGAAGLAAALGAAVLPVSLVAISAGVLAALFGREAVKGAFLGVPSGDGGKPRTPEGDLGAELGAVAPQGRRGTWVDPPARVQKQSYNGAADEQPAAFQRAAFVVDDLSESIGRLNRALSTRLSPGVTFASLGSGPSVPPSRLTAGPVPGFPSLSGGSDGAASRPPAVPGWFGRGDLGGGVSAPMLKGQAAENAKASFDFFRSKGLSPEAASGILASMQRESSFNPGARGDGGRAHGLFQHHPDRRAAILRGTGIDMSTAPLAKQLEGTWWEMNHGDRGAQRALNILKTPGISARDAGAAFVQHFERPARDERAERGAIAEGFARRFGANGQGAPGTVQAPNRDTSGLRIKSAEAVAGGPSAPGIVALMKSLQADGLPGGFGRVTALNDLFHKGRRSKHNEGLAADLTLLDPSRSAEAAEAIRARLRASGLAEGAFRVLDEYRNPSGHATGGHLHVQMNDRAAAAQYAKSIGARPSPAEAAGAVPQRPAATPWAGPGGEQPRAGGSGAGASASAGATTVHVTNNFNAAKMTGPEMAGTIQRHVTEIWNYRSHDLEPELT